MGRSARGRLLVSGVRGRDGSTDSPLEIRDDLAAECLNVDLWRSGLARKRYGSAANAITDGANVFAATLAALMKFVPGNDLTAAQLFGVDTGGTVGRVAASSAWVAVTCLDAFTSDAINTYAINGASLNGKFYIAGDTAVDRLHVWDGSTVRRVGLGTPAAPTVANTGAGAYAAVQRWYRQRYRRKSGSTVVSESEASSAVAFTPSGGGTAARVTKAASISEGETHWVLEASNAGSSGPFYEIAETVVGTTTYDDSAATTTYPTNTATQPVGTFTVPTSAKFLMNSGTNRLLMAGSWESGGYNSRVWFTAASGALRADDERIPQTLLLKYYVDLDENDGGSITGLGGPLNGQPIVFKERQIWRLIPTGDADAPYEPRKIADGIGGFNHRTIVMGRDESGRPALYFMSHEGPYRLGSSGLQRLDTDVRDVVDRMSFTSFTSTQFALSYTTRDQVWFSVKTGSNYERLKFHTRLGRPDEHGVVRGGWSLDTGDSVDAVAAGVMFAATVGASMGVTDKPYVGRTTDAGPLMRCDDSSVTADAGTAFRSYVETKPRTPALGWKVRTGQPLVAGVAASGTPTITVEQVRDYGAETRTCSTTITTTRGHHLCEAGSVEDGAEVVAFRVGDASAISTQWTLDFLSVPWETQEERGGL